MCTNNSALDLRHAQFRITGAMSPSSPVLFQDVPGAPTSKRDKNLQKQQTGDCITCFGVPGRDALCYPI